MRCSNQIMHVNAFQLKISRNTSVGFMTCCRETGHAAVRGGSKGVGGLGLVLADMGKAKETGLVFRLKAVRKRSKSMIGHLNKSYPGRGSAKVITGKEQQSLR